MSPEKNIPEEDLEGLRTQRPIVNAQKIIATHTVKEGETLSQIALKYYGAALPEYWNHIYEANKNILSSPNVVAAGQELKIPEKP